MAYFGFIRPFTGADVDVKPPYEPNKEPYHLPVFRKNFIYYAINNARLRPVDEYRLQRFAATELPAFRNPETTVVINGFADRPDTEPNNLILSSNRAENENNYLEAILGDDFLPEKNVVFDGNGESKVRGKEDVFDPSARRVEIEVNGDVVFGVTPGDDHTAD